MSQSEILRQTASLNRLKEIQIKLKSCQPPPSLIAVSKTFGPEHIWPLIAAGHRVFGENRIQEAASKWPALRAQARATFNEEIELHLIGRLQSNKVSQALALFDVIQSVDRENLIASLLREEEKTGFRRRYFIQVNIDGEPQKGGADPAKLSELIASMQAAVKDRLVGLMCIPEMDKDPSLAFQTLSALADTSDLSGRSMGMSADYNKAIANGATHIRLGRTIFGARN